MLLSLIIPIYNVDNYLDRCLDSCVSQDLSESEYELVLVNDGSTDDSLTIAKQFAEKHTNVKVFSQGNKGLSEARNAGLRQAVGKYVWFIDSDDWISSNCLKGIVDTMDSCKLDALHIGSVVAFDYPELNVDRIPAFTVSRGLDVLGQLKIWHQAQLTIFCRQFLLEHKLEFYPCIYHEDMEFIPRAYYFANRCAAMSEIYYYYYQRLTGAITSEYKPKNIIDAIFVTKRLIAFGNENNLIGIERGLWSNLLSVNINNMFRMAAKTRKKHPEIIEDIVANKSVYQSMLNAQRLIYRIEGLLVSNFPTLMLKFFTYKS